MTSFAGLTARTMVCDRRAATAVEFAICCLALVMIVVGLLEYGRLVWNFQVLQEAATEGARCMGLRAASCASGGSYSAGNTRNYVVNLASSRGVTITTAMVTLNNTATCGGAAGFSTVTISDSFTTVAPALLKSLASGLTVHATACFPNSS